ncbi:metal-dependent hydrolase, partial [Escherichia coli]|nr:metal-dependent hydrolase [Escherichia coli]
MTATGTASPVRANFPVRRMDFSFSETPKYWWDGQPFMTQFMNNLSSLFPYGEKFFVDSVRAVRDRLEDPQLKKDVSAFIGQEAMHSKEHAAYNEYAEEHGV